MLHENTGHGFLSRLKHAFSSSSESHDAIDTIPSTTRTVNYTTEEVLTEEEPITYASRYDSQQSITEKEISLRTVEVSAPVYSLPAESDLDIRFATKFSETGGKFIFCESVKEAVEGMQMLKNENGWKHIFCWENEIKDAFGEANFQKGAIGFTIENSDAAVSLCETLIADDGTIILNPKQASRRRLTCFPKTHIILTDVAHLKANEMEGLEKFYRLHKGELPSIVKLGSCNNGHFYDKQRLILNAEGTEDVYVFLVDQFIPPSLRP
jgi:L-lactate dehydrogenase complex protein LldG